MVQSTTLRMWFVKCVCPSWIVGRAGAFVGTSSAFLPGARAKQQQHGSPALWLALAIFLRLHLVLLQ